MAEIKPLERISEKWTRVSQVSQAEYEAGVRSPRKDWAEQTVKSADAYAKGVQAAISAGRFAKGVSAVGSSKWQLNAIAKGPGRWSAGIALAQSAYERGFAPYRQVIEGLSLPARGPVGDPQNYRRVQVVGDALHKEKLRRLGG